MSLMQIPRKIEYALRAMIYLADHPSGVARGTEIASREHIPKYYLEKVVRDLMRRGLVRARRGPGGGYQLARNADSVTFRDIIDPSRVPSSSIYAPTAAAHALCSRPAACIAFGKRASACCSKFSPIPRSPK